MLGTYFSRWEQFCQDGNKFFKMGTHFSRWEQIFQDGNKFFKMGTKNLPGPPERPETDERILFPAPCWEQGLFPASLLGTRLVPNKPLEEFQLFRVPKRPRRSFSSFVSRRARGGVSALSCPDAPLEKFQLFRVPTRPLSDLF